MAIYDILKEDDVAISPEPNQSGGLFGFLGRKIKDADAKSRKRLELLNKGLSYDTQIKQPVQNAAKPLSNIGQPTAIPKPVITKPQNTLASIGRPQESQIGKQGKIVLDSTGTPQWQGLTGGWMRNEDTGETYAIGANRGSKMRKVDSNGNIVSGFKEKTPLAMNTSPYEITDSSLSPAETKRFMRTPVHGGARAVSGALRNRLLPGISQNNNSNNLVNAPKEKSPLELAKELMGPLRIDTSGFSGSAAKARAHTQRSKYQTKLAKLAGNLSETDMREQGATKRKVMGTTADTESRKNANNLAAIKETNINKRFGATQALDKAKYLLNRKDKLSAKNDEFKFIPDVDPISGNKLSTGKFYNSRTGEWKQQSKSSGNDAADFLAKYK